MAGKARIGQSYKRKFRHVTWCIYCGENAESLDHVYPRSLAAMQDLSRPGVLRVLARGLVVVPSCMECNCIAHNKPFFSILAKRAEIQRLLKKRYARALKAAVWDEDEVLELGMSLRTKIVSAMRKMDSVERRISFPHGRSRVSAGVITAMRRA